MKLTTNRRMDLSVANNEVLERRQRQFDLAQLELN